jgi:hypothetical protein
VGKEIIALLVQFYAYVFIILLLHYNPGEAPGSEQLFCWCPVFKINFEYILT